MTTINSLTTIKATDSKERKEAVLAWRDRHENRRKTLAASQQRLAARAAKYSLPLYRGDGKEDS